MRGMARTTAVTAVALLGLLACDEQIETIQNDLQIDLRACMGLGGDVRRSACSGQVSSRVRPEGTNGCLILAMDGGRAVHHVGVRWANDWFTLVSPPAISGPPGQAVSAEFFLFAGGDDRVACDANSLPFGTT